MNLQAWYDDDNTEYTTQQLKEASKEEHDPPQKTEVFQRVDLTEKQLKPMTYTDSNSTKCLATQLGATKKTNVWTYDTYMINNYTKKVLSALQSST
eukprot:4498555-Amphidinium_carterae.1